MFKRLFLPVLLCFLLYGCGAPLTGSRAVSTDFFAMDTVMHLSAYSADETLLDDAAQLIYQLEAELSTTDELSAIYALNHSGQTNLSTQSADMLQRTLELCADTGGALDISVYPIVQAWGFTGEDHRIPEDSELAELLHAVDYTAISLRDRTVTLPEGMQIDLGSVAKGYAGDLVLSLFRERGISSALLRLGGNVQTLGTKPDGSLWRIGIQDPLDPAGTLGSVLVEDKAVVTSGGYERYFTDESGTVYWHIMDPSTGKPARSGLISVTIVGGEGLRCDALSTALFIMGEDSAINYWQARQDFDMILVTDDGRVLVSEGIWEDYTPTEDLAYEIREITHV